MLLERSQNQFARPQESLYSYLILELYETILETQPNAEILIFLKALNLKSFQCPDVENLQSCIFQAFKFLCMRVQVKASPLNPKLLAIKFLCMRAQVKALPLKSKLGEAAKIAHASR